MPELNKNLTKEMLSKEQLLEITLTNFFRDVPDDYDTEGLIYIDSNGNRSDLHPSNNITN